MHGEPAADERALPSRGMLDALAASHIDMRWKEVRPPRVLHRWDDAVSIFFLHAKKTFPRLVAHGYACNTSLV